MICVSIAPYSRRLARADMLNAAGQCHLVELCLDRFKERPDVAELVGSIDKPVIIACRNRQQGGQWDRGEDERLEWLRLASEAGPAYLELDHSEVDQVPVKPSTKLIVAFHPLNEGEPEPQRCFEQAAAAGAELVKFIGPTPTLDMAWPLLKCLGSQHDLPVLGVGIGAGALAFSLLIRKLGLPWTYASLEHSRHSPSLLPPIQMLDDIYRWRTINAQTAFVAVQGFGQARLMLARVFNRAFERLKINARCLPVEVGDIGQLAKCLERMKIHAVVSSRPLGEHLLPLASQCEESAEAGGNADLLLKKSDGWRAYNCIWRSALAALERTLRRDGEPKNALENRNVVLFGTGREARSMLHGLKQRGAWVTITTTQDSASSASIQFCGECGTAVAAKCDHAEELADETGMMFARFADVGQIRATLNVFAERELELGYGPAALHPLYLSPEMTVLDVTRFPDDSELIGEARLRGCRVVEPMELFADHARQLFKSITGQDLPRGVFLDEL